MAQIWTWKGSYAFLRVRLSTDFSNCSQKNENHICLHPTKLLFACTNVNFCIQGDGANTMTHTGFSNAGGLYMKSNFHRLFFFSFRLEFLLKIFPQEIVFFLVLCEKSWHILLPGMGWMQCFVNTRLNSKQCLGVIVLVEYFIACYS